MEAKELMIGDWVRQKEGMCANCVLQLEEVHELEFAYNYEPIPLTPEILEKNGAEICYSSVLQDKYQIWSVDDTICVEYKFSKQTEANNRLKIYVNGGEAVNVHLLYVHELQHALRLCGLNEFADNFQIE